MERPTRTLLNIATLIVPPLASGCVVAPRRAHYAMWIPGHWSADYGGVWIRGHWR